MAELQYIVVYTIESGNHYQAVWKATQAVLDNMRFVSLEGQRSMRVAPISGTAKEADELMDEFWEILESGELSEDAARELLESEGVFEKFGSLEQQRLWESKVAIKKEEVFELAAEHLFIDFIVPRSWSSYPSD